MIVDPDLLGDHRFALGHRPRAGRAADAEDDVARLVGVAGEMHMPAAAHLLLVGFQVEIEMRERVVLDVPRRVAQRLEFRQPLGRLLGACR